jgi:hypothetical protein
MGSLRGAQPLLIKHYPLPLEGEGKGEGEINNIFFTSNPVCYIICGAFLQCPLDK